MALQGGRPVFAFGVMFCGRISHLAWQQLHSSVLQATIFQYNSGRIWQSGKNLIPSYFHFNAILSLSNITVILNEVLGTESMHCYH